MLSKHYCYYATRVAKAWNGDRQGWALTCHWNPGNWLWAIQGNTSVCWNPTSAKREKERIITVTSEIPGGTGHMVGSLHFPYVVPLSTQRSLESPTTPQLWAQRPNSNPHSLNCSSWIPSCKSGPSCDLHLKLKAANSQTLTSELGS